jgi:hypothetical protein
MAYILTLEILLDVDDDCEASDGINEVLREHQRDFSPGSCLIDYQIVNIEKSSCIIPSNYEEGDFLLWPDKHRG